MNLPHVDPETFAELAGDSRAAALRHVAGCAACRCAIADREPELLFALLSLESESPEILDAVSEGVYRRLADPRPSWVESLRERGLPPVAARVAVAAAVAACGLLFLRAPTPMAPQVAVAAPERGGVTLVEPAPEAQVIDLTVGGTQVVMIFDPELKL